MRIFNLSMLVISTWLVLTVPVRAQSETVEQAHVKRTSDAKRTSEVTSHQKVSTDQKKELASNEQTDENSSPVDYEPFMKLLQTNIRKGWHPPKSEESRKATLLFKVFRDGRITNIRIEKSTGVAAADEAAIKAIEVASNQTKLPPASPEFVDVQFNFDYNVFRNSANGKNVNGDHRRRAHSKCFGSRNSFESTNLAVPLFIFLSVGLINILRALQRRRAPIWIIGSALLGFFASIGFIWPLINAVR